MRFQPQRQKSFIDLAFDGALIRQEQIFGQLLRDGGATLNHAASLGIGDQGAGHALDIDSEMLVEAAIFRCQHRLDQVIGKLVERYRFSVLDTAAADLVAVTVKERHREIGFLEPIVVGSLAE